MQRILTEKRNEFTILQNKINKAFRIAVFNEDEASDTQNPLITNISKEKNKTKTKPNAD